MAPRRKGRKRRNSEEWSEDWDEEGSKRSSPFKVSRKEIRGPNGGKRQVLYTWNSNFQEYKERIRTQCKLLAYLLYHSVSENEKDQAFVREIIKDLNGDKYLTEEAKNFMNYIRNHPNVLNETTSMDLSMTLNKSSSSPRKRQRVKQESDAQSTNQLTDEESSRSPVAGGSSDQEGSYSPPTPLSAENETIPLSSLLPLATTEKDEMEPLYVNTDALSDVLQASGSTNVINGYSTAVILLTLYRKRLYSFDTLVSQLVHNSDPFLHTQWHQYPYTQRPFLPLHDYVPCEGLTTDMEQETMHRMLFTARSSAPSFSPSLPSNLQSSPLAEDPLFQHVQFGRDVMIKDTWGIDCYTRHSIEILLQLLGWESSLVTTFVRTVLAPTINQQTPTTAFDMRNTLFSLLDKNEVYVEGAIALLQFYLDLGPGYLRIHPKGKGILCCNPQGIPANLSIAPYLGEVYPPWKWFEKQEAVKKAIKEFKLEDVLPDFYNILLERTTDSESGYDCLFIDPVYKGNFSSRLSHSCEPNCATTPITIGKRALIALSSVKPIQLGEELCFDYSCVSESNKEFQKAICLCGSPQCRGSFVSYADGKSFNQVISLAYHFLRRTRVLYEASTLPLTSDDILKLNQVGIRSSVLAGCPPWLVKYVSLTLDFIQFELKALPDVLLHMPLVVPYTKTTALIESKGVYASRLQNLVISLDKVRYFLSKQPEDYQQQTLFKSLEENEMMDFLWNGPQSVMKRLFRSYFTSPICPGASAEEYQRMVEWNMKYTTIHTQSMEEVRALMIELRNLLWTLKGPNEYKHKAAGDVLTFYIHTHVYFTPNEYKQIHSPEAIVRGCDISCSAEKLIRLVHRSLDRTLSNSTIPNHVRQLIEQVTEERKRGLKKEDEREGIAFVTEQQPTLYEEVWNRMTVEEQLFYSNAKVYSHSKNYCTSFIWGQLNNWYKQTIDNPSASLSAERRGCLSLPDIECVYDATFKYSEATRVQFFKCLFENPTSMWKLEYGWGFRNTQHVYGTPMFDCVLGHHNHFEEFLNDISLEIHTSYKRYRHSKRSNGLSALELLNVGYSEFPMFKD